MRCVTCHEPKYEIQIRYIVILTKKGEKIGDELPSGAEVIEYTSEEDRRIAEAIKRDLGCVTIPSL